jgi:hypothetical protein
MVVIVLVEVLVDAPVIVVTEVIVLLVIVVTTNYRKAMY